MICVAKENLDAEIFENILRNALNRSQCSHGHEDRGFDFAMRGEQAAAAAWTRGRINLESQGH